MDVSSSTPSSSPVPFTVTARFSPSLLGVTRMSSSAATKSVTVTNGICLAQQAMLSTAVSPPLTIILT